MSRTCNFLLFEVKNDEVEQKSRGENVVKIQPTLSLWLLLFATQDFGVFFWSQLFWSKILEEWSKTPYPGYFEVDLSHFEHGTQPKCTSNQIHETKSWWLEGANRRRN